MEEQRHDTTVSRPSHHHRSGGGAEADHQRILHEPVRSRWTPKPEQILILESIFNSGMVNPPKDETVKIRKLLEKFGSVGDANVFYWFQNRRSRSRRRQRQMQAGLCGGGGGGGGEHQQQAQPRGGGNGGYSGGGIHYENLLAGGGGGLVAPNNHPVISYTSSNCLMGSSSSSSSSSCGFDGNIINGKNNSSDDLFLFSGHPGSVQDYDPNPGFCFAGGASTLNYQPEVITVFINGVATEMGRGAVDMKAVFGGDFVLFHSSGMPVQVNEYGFLVQSLQHGESYFLVPKH